jgi:hypothetical protein
VVDHLHHLSFAPAHRFGHDADKFFRAIDHDLLDRFLQFAVHPARDDLRFGNLQLVTFATHHLDHNGELQFTAAGNFELVGRVRLFHANGDVAEDFSIQAFIDLP